MGSLQEYVGRGGCACKIGPHLLEQVLKKLPPPVATNQVLVNMEHADDAGVYKLTDEVALVQTLDFFTPVVADPFLYGKIAATNSLSDIYAMGGTPITAMHIVAFPVPLVTDGTLEEVLKGSDSVLQAAKVPLLGGHSIEDDIPKFGVSVTGLVHPEKIWRNDRAEVGDALILTKGLGTGILGLASRGDIFPKGVEDAIASMTMLNAGAAEVAKEYTIHACTDVTGFSLMGHGTEMANGSHVSLQLEASLIPLLADVQEAAEMGLVPASSYGNRKAVPHVYFEASLPEWVVDICYDPQTSGGLLFALPQEEVREFLKDLHDAGVVRATCIGQVIERGEYPIYVHQ